MLEVVDFKIFHRLCIFNVERFNSSVSIMLKMSNIWQDQYNTKPPKNRWRHWCSSTRTLLPLCVEIVKWDKSPNTCYVIFLHFHFFGINSQIFVTWTILEKLSFILVNVKKNSRSSIISFYLTLYLSMMFVFYHQ